MKNRLKLLSLASVIVVFSFVVATSCHTTNSTVKSIDTSGETSASAVLIFTLDGLGFDILSSTDEGRAFIAENNVTRLIPPIPAVTFPSHATMIFGLDPEMHGVLKNFSDPTAYAAPGVVIDPFKAPVWQRLKAAKVRLQLSSVSELKRFGDVKPMDVDAFAEVESKFKLMQTLAPSLAHGPDLISLAWNEGTDKTGHAYGPNSKEVHDRLIELLAELHRVKELAMAPNSFPYKHTTFIFVSDHGMAELKHCVPYFTARESTDFTHGASYALLKTDKAVTIAKDFIANNPDATLKLYHNPELLVKGVLLLPEGYRFDNAGPQCELLAKGNHEFDPFKYPSQHGVFWAWNAKVDTPHPVNNVELMDFVAAQLLK